MSSSSHVVRGHGRLTTIIGLTIVAGIFVGLATAAHAVTSISQSFNSDKQLPVGSLVSLKSGTTDAVVGALPNNVDGLIGVIITTDNSLLSVSNGLKNQVQVATSGTVPVLVSDINGEVKLGDHLTASPIDGIGMRATGNVRIVGIAQSDVSSATKQTYKDKGGQEHSVMIGQVPALISVAYYFKEPDKTLIPSAIQNLANALAGKTVNTLPILISAGIFVVMLIIVVSIIYSMIRSSIISVGRNPMSQSAVYRNVIQMSALVLVILGVGFSSMYLVLTRI
jgi:hypothetical protein